MQYWDVNHFPLDFQALCVESGKFNHCSHSNYFNCDSYKSMNIIFNFFKPHWNHLLLINTGLVFFLNLFCVEICVGKKNLKQTFNLFPIFFNHSLLKMWKLWKFVEIRVKFRVLSNSEERFLNKLIHIIEE